MVLLNEGCHLIPHSPESPHDDPGGADAVTCLHGGRSRRCHSHRVSKIRKKRKNGENEIRKIRSRYCHRVSAKKKKIADGSGSEALFLRTHGDPHAPEEASV